MDEQRRGSQIVPIQPNDVFRAGINNGLDANSLDADEVIPIDSLIVIHNTTWPVGITMTGCNLSQDEQDWLEGGIAEFNNSRYWHAHEDWEELWKSLKSRNVDLDYILGIQGLIQTTALMFQYERMKKRGCLSMWSKLTEKLGTPDAVSYTHLRAHET